MLCFLLKRARQTPPQVFEALNDLFPKRNSKKAKSIAQQCNKNPDKPNSPRTLVRDLIPMSVPTLDSMFAGFDEFQ
jgi:hypothetical protein